MRAIRATLLATVAALALCAAVAVAKPTMTAPAHTHVGDDVHVSAHGLQRGRYGLVLSADRVSGRDVACVAHLARASSAATAVSLEGRIPPKLTCWTNNSVKGGRIETKPGPYHLIVGIPNGPAGFSGSFVRAPVRIDAK